MLLNLFAVTNLKRYTLLGLSISVTLHIMLIPLALRPPAPHFPEPLMVNFISEQSLAAMLQLEDPQIVSEPENPVTTEENDEAKHLAEFARITPQEQIRRGDNPLASQHSEPQSTQSESAPPPPKQMEAAPPKKDPIPVTKKQPNREVGEKPALLLPPDLTLSSKATLDKFGTMESKPKEANPLANLDVVDFGSYQPFSRPTGSGAAFLGMRGHSDYLPHLADGDITLLNTKASKFAVFVRRVATQVFSELRHSGWENLGAGDIYGIRDFSRIRATMNLEGELIEVKLEGRSGSHKFDQTVLAAVKKGARDPRPPPEAAVDEKITFTFQAKSWVRQTTDPRSGFPSQARWLLLGTGLE